jgi:large subunit ribosomal protein L25
MEKKVLQAAVRSEISKASRSTLRQSGRVPGVIYARNMPSISVAVAENDINPFVFTSDTHIIAVKLDNKEEYDCVLKDKQFDPVTDRVVHFDLQALVSGETIEMEVPVVLTGAAVGVKDGGVLQQFFHRVSVECLPIDIPEHIVLDVVSLKIGQSIHIRDIAIHNVKFLQPSETVLVGVVPPRGAETTAADGEAPAEPEVIAKGKEKQPEE